MSTADGRLCWLPSSLPALAAHPSAHLLVPTAASPWQVGITEAIALAGALFGGISSRQRKREVEGAQQRADKPERCGAERAAAAAPPARIVRIFTVRRPLSLSPLSLAELNDKLRTINMSLRQQASKRTESFLPSPLAALPPPRRQRLPLCHKPAPACALRVCFAVSLIAYFVFLLCASRARGWSMRRGSTTRRCHQQRPP